MDLSRAQWHKSSRSTNQGHCVEVAFGESAVATRDSKAPDAGALVFGWARWSSFVAALSHGRFDI